MTHRTGLAVAAAAAALFLTAAAPVQAADEAKKVQCEGVNSCKGKSECHTANSSCKGQNSCKGKGWIEMSAADCEKAKAKLKKT
jgi:hypothetical protein